MSASVFVMSALIPPLVVDHEVGPRPAGGVIGLSGEALPRLMIAQPVPGHHPRDLGLRLTDHRDEHVELWGEVVLDDERRLIDHPAVALLGVALSVPGYPRQDRWVGQRVQVLEGRGITKDDSAERFSVEGARGEQDLRAEALDDLPERRLPDLDHLARHLVRVDDRDTALSKALRHAAFT